MRIEEPKYTLEFVLEMVEDLEDAGCDFGQAMAKDSRNLEVVGDRLDKASTRVRNAIYALFRELEPQ